MFHRTSLGLCVACLLLLSGCGGNGELQISGKVTLDGAPIERGTIRFVAEDGTGPAFESTITSGAYTVSMPAGPKKVSILGYKKIGEHHVQGPDSPLVDDLQQIVPAQFNEQTTLIQKVETSSAAVNFDLKTS